MGLTVNTEEQTPEECYEAVKSADVVIRVNNIRGAVGLWLIVLLIFLAGMVVG